MPRQKPQYQDLGEKRLELAALHDPVDEAVLFKILGGLEIRRKLLVDGVFDHAAPCKADEGARFGDVDVAEHCV